MGTREAESIAASGGSQCAVLTRTRARQTSRLALRHAASRWPSVFHRFPLHCSAFTVLVCVPDVPEELREVLVLALDLEEDEEERVVQRLGALLAARIPHPPGPRLTRHPPVDRKTNSLIGSDENRSKMLSMEDTQTLCTAIVGALQTRTYIV